jgi:hypothetical protein
MAARRLIIVMLVLLGISTAVAIIAPDPAERSADSGTTGSTSREETGDGGPTETTGTTGTTGQTGATGGSGGDQAGGAAADAAGEGASGTDELAFTVSDSPQNLCARPGSRVILTVRTTEPLDVSIPDFGRTASVTQYAPEPFDLLLPEGPGSYDVEALATGRTLATIRSNDSCRPPKRKAQPEPQ